MKTPKEKAKEIYLKLYIPDYCYAKPGMAADWRKRASKRYALTAVDEILNAIDWHNYETPNKELSFWHEVKQEIEKI
jgi:hypothetical protein